MKFNAGELVGIEGLLPAKANIVDQITAKSIRGKVELSAADAEAVGLNVRQREDGKLSIRMNAEKAAAFVREVEFNAGEVELLKRRVGEIDGKKEVTSDQVDLLLKIRDLTA